jgi:hypothetical protein
MGKITYKVFLLIIGLLFVVTTSNVYALDLVVSDNGDGSSSEVSVSIDREVTVDQTNTSDIQNNVDVDANTGGNEASSNTGGEVAITTGDISSSTDISTSANSSVANTGCCGQDVNVQVSGNGSGSTNSVNLNQITNTNVNISQTANVDNVIKGTSNTGNNIANSNMGNINISTGDVKTSLRLVNSPINIAGATVATGNGDVEVKISGNGDDSDNYVSLNFENITETFINSSSDIDNYLVWDANTGGNQANGNNGVVEISTGDIDLEILIKNLTNINDTNINCCVINDPDDPDIDDPTDTPNGGKPSNGAPSSNGSSGSTLSDTAAMEAGGPGVAGLSDTSSKTARQIFYYIGFLLIIFGIKNLGKSLEDTRLNIDASTATSK